MIQLARPFAPELSLLADVSDELTIHGVETKYPGEWRQIKKSEMKKAVELAKRFCDILIVKLKGNNLCYYHRKKHHYLFHSTVY